MSITKNNKEQRPIIIETRGINNDGTWIHSEGSDYIFYYRFDSWNEEQKEVMRSAFIRALQVPNKIKEAVKETSGEEVVNGLYTSNSQAMIKALNTITGMSQTNAVKRQLIGNGTIQDANAQLFNDILSGVGGTVNPMRDYLNRAMAATQATAAGNTTAQHLGTTITLLSLVPGLNIALTSVVYAVSTATSAAVLIKHKCSNNTTRFSYNVDYTKVGYSYQEPV
ncbi:hypothetical protein [uncultured Kordia sp.]|uniref:hypothetical protein n=1 Tax=uncultured Kordia sp. TaxID=507699 RepID=UPI0026128CB2|nr:hypothetical protein [uncultured Kordia sp.]